MVVVGWVGVAWTRGWVGELDGAEEVDGAGSARGAYSDGAGHDVGVVSAIALYRSD
jgi:hypothetical protein